MPTPVTSWVFGNPLSAKSLVLAAYTCDGSGDHPNGVAFNALRPILAEAYNRTPTLTTASGGVQTALSTSGATTGGLIVVDSAGYFGMTQDQPIAGYYQFLAAVNGSAGDGVTAGGWTLVAHMAAIAHGATQTSISADLLGTGGINIAGTRQAPSASQDNTAFFLDLVNAASTVTWQPAVTIRDSGAANATTVVSTDGSGETCRLCAIWAAVTAAASGQAIFAVNGVYPFTAPAGVTSITAANTGAGGGAGGGNASAGGIERGGGGGGGGEFATNSVGVTPGNNYTVTVGAGGAGGTAPTSNAGTPGPGSAGGNSVFTGDSLSVTGHGGSGGGGATGAANGTGGAGGTGASGGTHHNGGAGATGSTGTFGGGGGSSAGPAVAGVTATGAQGAGAVAGGAPGGAGGAETIHRVQSQMGWAKGDSKLTVTMNAPFQAGNTVMVMLFYQGKSNPPGSGSLSHDNPVVQLGDGTPLTSQVSADVTNETIPFQVRLFDTQGITGGVPGGESRVNITCHGTGTDVEEIIAEVYEVAGLGPSPTIDVSATHTQGPASADNFYTSNPAGNTNTTKAPEFWVAMTGAHSNAPFSVNYPAKSQGWQGLQSKNLSQGGYTGVVLTGYQIATAAGPIQFNGTFSAGATKGAYVAAYTTSATTPGAAPVIGPGGGGGAGLGISDNGGSGSDGQVVLTWTGASGSGFGTPLLPAPYSGWSDATTVGTTSAAAVNVNSNAGIRDVLNFLANPPVFRISQASAVIVNQSSLTAIAFAGASPTVDNYSGWNSGAGVYTVQRDGLYLFHALAPWSASSTGTVRAAGVTVNPGGTGAVTLWGPPGLPTASGSCNVSKTALLDLHAGDTVSLSVYQDTSAPLALSGTDQTRFLLTWLSELGTPAGAWSPPDTTFRWAAATQPTADNGQLTALLQQHLGNDLNFLVNRPYLLSYQLTAQSGLTASAFTTVNLNSSHGLIWNTAGDNYGGWTSGASNSYTAQEAGWYLACGEVFSSTLSGGSARTVIAGLQVSSSGGVTPLNATDYYQQNAVTNATSFGGGATVYGLIYLNVGESVTPVINGNGYASTYSTNVGSVGGGAFRSHFGLVWMSN